MRSRTGCLTCRQRKLKCDEQRPVCGQCTKGNRDCQPSGGLTFRHQHNASMNANSGGSPTTRKPSLSSFYSYKNTFDADTVWCDVPKQLFFFNTTNPYLDPGTPDLAGLLASGYLNSYGLQHQRQWDLDPRFQNRHDIPSELHSHGLEALSAAALYSPPKANMISRPKPSGRSEHDNPLGPSSSLQRHDEQSTSTGLAISSSKNLNFLLNPTPTMDSPIDPNLMASALNQAPHAEEPSSSHKTANGEHLAGEAESEQKVAYLLRHFSDTPGQ